MEPLAADDPAADQLIQRPRRISRVIALTDRVPESLGGVCERVDLPEIERVNFCYQRRAIDLPFCIQSILPASIKHVS